MTWIDAQGCTLGRLSQRPPAVLPLLSIAARSHPRPSLVAIGEEFAKLGVIVFGSGYVLLAFLRRDLVNQLG